MNYSDLIIQKMHLDKQFSIFLDQNTLDEDNTDTPEWKTYKTMLKDYEAISYKIKLAEFKMGRH